MLAMAKRPQGDSSHWLRKHSMQSTHTRMIRLFSFFFWLPFMLLWPLRYSHSEKKKKNLFMSFFFSLLLLLSLFLVSSSSSLTSYKKIAKIATGSKPRNKMGIPCTRDDDREMDDESRSSQRRHSDR